jgi:hypothetical protein
MAGLALVCVGLRAEQTRRAAEILQLESQWVQLRHDRWEMQTRAARLRTPNRLHARVRSIDSDLQMPLPIHQQQEATRLSYDYDRP